MTWTNPPTRSTGFAVTATVWNNEHVGNMDHLTEVNYTEFTSDVAITGTTVGAANQIVTSGPITYEAVPHMIEFEAWIEPGATGSQFIILRDGTTVLGTLGRFAAGGATGPVSRSRRITPTAASHTYNVACWNASALGAIKAGPGGTAGDNTTHLPGFIRIYRVPT